MLDGLPKAIRIGAYNITIEIRDDLKVDGREAWGAYVADDKQIFFHKDQGSSTRALESFIHELNHAIYDAATLKKGDDEERLVTALSITWTQVLRDNPKVLKWMQKIAGLKNTTR